MTSPRKVAFEALLDVERHDAYLNLVLPRLINKYSIAGSDGGFTTELAYGTARNQGFYDWVIEQAAKRSIAELDDSVVIVLRLGAHQLLVLETPPHAAIFETVELAKSVCGKSAIPFVNACLRRISERTELQWLGLLDRSDLGEEDYLSVRYSHPAWVTRSIKLALQSEGAAAELEEALAADNANPKVNLVALPGRLGVESESLQVGLASPIGYVLTGGDPAKLPEVERGDFRVQDQGSQLTALALAASEPIEPGEQWLDLCAGPGGKAVLLAALAKQGGASLTTNEIAEHRAKLVATALRHSGQTATQLTKDGRKLGVDSKFDRIMLDAPCTGLGALRRRPESRWRKDAKSLKELTELQRELLVAAWDYLKPGGTLHYVTCSPHPAETTAQIEWLLRAKQGAQLLNVNDTMRGLNPELELSPNRKTAQLWPHRNGTDAMFMASIRKPKVG